MSATYAEVAAKAEQVASEELEELLAADDNPTVWPGPRRHSRIAMYAQMYRTVPAHPFVGFDFCNHGGFTDQMTVWPRLPEYAPVFEIAGRLVKWVRP